MSEQTGKTEGYQIIGECEVDEEGEIVKIDRGWFRQGYVYKNPEAYAHDKKAVCYIPELSDTAYTGEDFLRMCNDQPEIADQVFDAVDWQHPESYLDEQGDDELCMCECGKWYWCYGVSHCPHCGAENPSYDENDSKKGGNLMEERFFKILADDLQHFEHAYHVGMNVDQEPFKPWACHDGGLFFADEKHILEFCDLGNKIAKVIIPKEELVIKVCEAYKAHQIILDGIRGLWNIDTFRWLAECGVDLHAGNDWAFRLAAEEGHLDIVAYLLKMGADVHSMNDYALYAAADRGNLNMVKLLVEASHGIIKQKNKALYIAEKKGYSDVVHYLKSFMVL